MCQCVTVSVCTVTRLSDQSLCPAAKVKSELEAIAASSVAGDITRVLTVDVANKRHQLIKGASINRIQVIHKRTDALENTDVDSAL